VLEDPVAVEQAREMPRRKLVADPLLERVLLVEGDRAEVVADLGLLVADALPPQKARDALLVGHLADDCAPPPAGACETQRERHGGLPDPALAGDEDEPLIE
jgi:hypothetical protein